MVFEITRQCGKVERHELTVPFNHPDFQRLWREAEETFCETCQQPKEDETNE